VVHHSDAGSQYLSIRYTDRLADAGVEPSVGSIGDSYDNALAETIIEFYKTELIHRRGPWRHIDPGSCNDDRHIANRPLVPRYLAK
jgi:putative transposase